MAAGRSVPRAFLMPERSRITSESRRRGPEFRWRSTEHIPKGREPPVRGGELPESSREFARFGQELPVNRSEPGRIRHRRSRFSSFPPMDGGARAYEA